MFTKRQSNPCASSKKILVSEGELGLALDVHPRKCHLRGLQLAPGVKGIDHGGDAINVVPPSSLNNAFAR